MSRERQRRVAHNSTRLQDCIMLNVFYNGSEEEGRKNFQKFYDLSE
jgi:hypothetical protein